MTVSTEISTAGPFYGNNATTAFPFEFKIVSADHLRAVLIDAAGNVSDLSLDDGDYSVAGVGSEDGGTVNKASPLLTGQTLTIVRNPPLTQETSLANQGPYNADVVESRFDLVTMQIQKVNEATERSLKVEPGQPLPDMALIAAAEGFAGAAQQSAQDAARFKQNASESADAAAGFADLANKFANNPEDQEVIPGSGLFSTKHYLAKATAIYTAALTGLASLIHGATAKNTLADTDEWSIADSAAGWALKKVTWLTAKLQNLVHPYVNVASAATTNIGAAQSKNVNITGTTTITAFDNVAAGTERWLKFAAALTLTYNATSLTLPGAASITVAAGDKIRAISLGSGNWELSQYEAATFNPAKVGVVQSAAVAMAAVASQDLTGIPAGVKRVRIKLDNLNKSANNTMDLLLGTAAGFSVTNYRSTSGVVYQSAGGASRSIVSFRIVINSNGVHDGWMELVRKAPGSNVWLLTGTLANDATQVNNFGGSCTLTAELTQVRVQVAAGTITGDVSMEWEF